jgi:integrase
MQRAAKAAEERAPAEAFAAIADRYMKAVERNIRPGTIKEARRILDHDAKPKWGDRPIAAITRQDVAELLDEIAARGAMVQANRTLARLKTLFRWALDEELVATDPTARVRRRTKETARDRTLSDDEIRWFWSGCEAAGWPFGPLFKLLLLTAQRRDEVGTLERSEIDLERRVWTIPRGKAKNDRAHEVPLSRLAVETIAGLPRLGNLVFSTTGTSPVSGFSRAKATLDARMSALAGEPVAEWILHDLRRTAATGMARLNIAPHVVDKVLNHVAGAISGVAAVYNRFQYLDERAAALEAWGNYVENLIRPAPGNVVPLRQGISN